MARAGLEVQSHVDLLAQQFWAQVTDEKRKSVLESKEAWCVPAAKVREHVEQLVARGDKQAAENVLRNYAQCIEIKAPEARRLTATGLAELASTYAKFDETLLSDTIRRVGVQLADETDPQLQSQDVYKRQRKQRPSRELWTPLPTLIRSRRSELTRRR